MADERRTLDQLQTATDARLGALLGTFARDFGRRIRRAGGAAGTIGPAGRATLATWLTGAIGALFGASPAAAERLYATPDTLPHLLAASTRAAAALGATPAVARVSRALAEQPALLAALTRPAANPRPPVFDPTRSWLDPNGHTLSARVWLAGEDIRTRIDALLDFHIAQGTLATNVAPLFERFLTLEGARPQTRTPYGRVGSYSARRLVRTEVARTYNISAAQAAALNPFVAAIGYRKSSAHAGEDICDQRASADPDGLGKGNYKAANFPAPPSHPQCMCYTLPIVRQDADKVIGDLARWARGERASGMDDLGTMPLDVDYLVGALTGFSPAPGA